VVPPVGCADRVKDVPSLAQRRPGVHHAPPATQPPAVGEQKPATPERPATEVRAEGLLEARRRFTLIVGEHGPGVAKVDRDPLGREVPNHRLDLVQPLAARLQAARVRRRLGQVADGHTGEMQMVGRVAGVEQPRGEVERLGMAALRQRRQDRAGLSKGDDVGGTERQRELLSTGVALSVAAASPRTAPTIAIAVSAVAIQMGWPSSVASRRASSASGIPTSQFGRRTASIACVASRRGRTPRRPPARALSIALAQNVRLS
jgi:hypothetical protein